VAGLVVTNDVSARDVQLTNAAWEKIDKYLLTDVVNAVPTAYYKQVQIAGSKVGGLVYDNVIGGIDPRRLYIK
ncbi:hypothetical protein ABZ372_40035, partial [Streptomyces sp. NPDC005921]